MVELVPEFDSQHCPNGGGVDATSKYISGKVRITELSLFV